MPEQRLVRGGAGTDILRLAVGDHPTIHSTKLEVLGIVRTDEVTNLDEQSVRQWVARVATPRSRQESRRPD